MLVLVLVLMPLTSHLSSLLASVGGKRVSVSVSGLGSSGFALELVLEVERERALALFELVLV